MKGNPVRIRGVDYPSQAAAARALGVSVSTIGMALAVGRPDAAGLGSGFGGGRPGKPCWYRGVRYPSRTAAARACGVSVAAVSKTVRAAAKRVWKVAA